MRVNGEIRAREVRVIAPDGVQLGVMPLREALRLAAEQEQDLVEVAPQANPPVCRIMNYGKFKYEQSKRDREARKRQKVTDLKEVRMTPKIEDHDFEVKTRNAERFLRDGDKVKFTVRFRGREIVHADLARKMLEDLAERLSAVSTVERPPRVEGRQMIMILAPRAGQGQQAPSAQAEPRAAGSRGAGAGAGDGDRQPARPRVPAAAEQEQVRAAAQAGTTE